MIQKGCGVPTARLLPGPPKTTLPGAAFSIFILSAKTQSSRPVALDLTSDEKVIFSPRAAGVVF